jgi:hypothetical protein
MMAVTGMRYYHVLSVVHAVSEKELLEESDLL